MASEFQIAQKEKAMKRLRRRSILKDEEGTATAEYAIATMAAVGFAGLLVAILRSDEVRGILLDLVHRALSFGG
jgi:Flp pilus assembly pilin Flp